jgi:hypothetical protein
MPVAAEPEPQREIAHEGTQQGDSQGSFGGGLHGCNGPLLPISPAGRKPAGEKVWPVLNEITSGEGRPARHLAVALRLLATGE